MGNNARGVQIAVVHNALQTRLDPSPNIFVDFRRACRADSV